MTDDAIHFDLFPEPVRRRVADIDTEIDCIERQRAELEEMIRDFVAEKGRKTAIREAIIETAQMFLASASWMNTDPSSQVEGDGVALNSMAHPVGDRLRRDIRGLVLEHLLQIQPRVATAKGIADELHATLRSVDKALAHHEAAGVVIRDEDIWQISEYALQQIRAARPPEPLDTMKVAIEAGLVPSGTSVRGPDDPPPTAEHVLDFITRCGSIGAGIEQLRTIGATQSVLNLLSHDETAYLREDGRWRATGLVLPGTSVRGPDGLPI